MGGFWGIGCVLNTAAGGGSILGDVLQIADGRIKAVLDRTKRGTGNVDFTQRRVNGADCRLGARCGGDIQLLHRGITRALVQPAGGCAIGKTEVSQTAVASQRAQGNGGVGAFVGGDKLQLAFADRGAHLTDQGRVTGDLLVDVVGQRFQRGVVGLIDIDGLCRTTTNSDRKASYVTARTRRIRTPRTEYLVSGIAGYRESLTGKRTCLLQAEHTARFGNHDSTSQTTAINLTLNSLSHSRGAGVVLIQRN